MKYYNAWAFPIVVTPAAAQNALRGLQGNGDRPDFLSHLVSPDGRLNPSGVTDMILGFKDDGMSVQDRCAMLANETRGAEMLTIFNSINKCAIRMPNEKIVDLRVHVGDSANITMEANQEVTAYQVPNPEWGLDRMDRCVGRDGLDYEPLDANGVRVYILDTGVDGNNDNLEGSIGSNCHWSFLDEDNPSDALEDRNGHGTHVAGTACGDQYGVAKNCEICSVKVLSNSGRGSTIGVIAGIEHAMNDCKAHGALCVINMSLGGPVSDAQDKAVENAFDEGVVVVAAAGNGADDACNYSPARVQKAITVGSITKNDDAMSSFSNRGQCVNVSAPGTDIKSTWPNEDGARTVSGTSTASAHVTGLAASIRSTNRDMTPEDVMNKIVADAKQAGEDPMGQNIMVVNSEGGCGNTSPDVTSLRCSDASATNINYSENDGLVCRNSVLLEYSNVVNGEGLDAVHWHTGSDVVDLTLVSGVDLAMTCSYEEAQTNAFNLTGHIIANNPDVKYTIICPACGDDGCHDHVCSVQEERDAAPVREEGFASDAMAHPEDAGDDRRESSHRRLCDKEKCVRFEACHGVDERNIGCGSCTTGGTGSDLHYGNRFCKWYQGTVGESSCWGDRACMSISNEDLSGYSIGRSSCRGDHACYNVTGNIGDYACRGDNACKGHIGNIEKCCQTATDTMCGSSCGGREGCRCNSDDDCHSDFSCYRPDGTRSSSCTVCKLKASCFSLESTVVVKGKGSTSIKDLSVGDMVLCDDSGTYSKFYSKGHYNEKKSTKFVRIFTEINTKPLELTEDHMVFMASRTLPVPARSVKVGDVVKTIDGPSKVTSVTEITRNGLFNPITLSGSIVVDGVVASVHSEEPGFEGTDAGWIYLAGKRIVHWHTLMHLIHAPHRIFCGGGAACAEKQDEDGLIPFHQFLEKLESTAAAKESVIFSAGVLLVVVSATSLFLLLELFMDHTMIVIAGICFGTGGWLIFKKLESSMILEKVIGTRAEMKAAA